MFDTANLKDEHLTHRHRHRLYGPYTLLGVKVDHAVFSVSKGTLYLMSGAKSIFKIYPRLTTHPHTALSHCIVGVEGCERLTGGTIRAIDRVDHIAETKNKCQFYYTRLILHTEKGSFTILCEDPPGKERKPVALQMEEADRYPPTDAVPLEDFQLQLPAQRGKDE